MAGAFPFAGGRDVVHSTGRVRLLNFHDYKQYNRDVVSHHAHFITLIFGFCRIYTSLSRPLPLSHIFNISRNMKSLRGAFALGLLPMIAVAQSVVTVRLPTCIPGGDTGILGGGTPGIPVPGPAPTGLRTEVIDITATISPGSITVEQVTQVITPGASAT